VQGDLRGVEELDEAVGGDEHVLTPCERE